MNDFFKKLRENTTKQIDENIYSRLVSSLKGDAMLYDGNEKKLIDDRCDDFRILFVNFDDYSYSLDSYKRFSGKLGNKNNKSPLDEKISHIVERELGIMEKEATSPKEQVQVLDRMIRLKGMLEDFDEEMEYIKNVSHKVQAQRSYEK